MNCIVTGLGGRGLHWIRQLRLRADCAITGFVEPAEPNRARAAQQHQVPETLIFTSLDEALSRAEADFVLDVTPPSAHAEVAERAFAAGLHVLGEKPLSDDFGVAQRMVESGERAGVKHMITQNYRFGACPRTTRRKLAEGIIGKPGQCDIRFYMPWADLPGSHYVTQPFMLINDMMVHHFDMLRYVLDADPVSVQAITWNHPWGWHAGDAAHAIVFQFPDGLVATHVSVGCAVGSRTTWNGDWRIEGPEGSLDWEQDRMWHIHLHRTEERRREEIFPLAAPAPEQAILDELFAAIREDREPECSARDNLKSLAMVFAAIRSAQEGSELSFRKSRPARAAPPERNAPRPHSKGDPEISMDARVLRPRALVGAGVPSGDWASAAPPTRAERTRERSAASARSALPGAPGANFSRSCPGPDSRHPRARATASFPASSCGRGGDAEAPTAECPFLLFACRRIPSGRAPSYECRSLLFAFRRTPSFPAPSCGRRGPRPGFAARPGECRSLPFAFRRTPSCRARAGEPPAFRRPAARPRGPGSMPARSAPTAATSFETPFLDERSRTGLTADRPGNLQARDEI